MSTDNYYIATIAAVSALSLYLLMKVSHRLLAVTSHDDDVACFVSSVVTQDEQSPPSLHPLLPPSSCPEKPTLVLDLDETLVHAKIQSEEPPYPAKIIVVEGSVIWFALRPFARQFLSFLAVHYELVVWTAGTEPYGWAVVKELDPSGSLISHSLFRQHCTVDEDDRFVKDLSRLGRDQRTRICDNNPVSFRFQPDSGILVKDFFGDPTDEVLKTLLCNLTKMALLNSFEVTNMEVRQGLLAVTHEDQSGKVMVDEKKVQYYWSLCYGNADETFSSPKPGDGVWSANRKPPYKSCFSSRTKHSHNIPAAASSEFAGDITHRNANVFVPLHSISMSGFDGSDPHLQSNLMQMNPRLSNILSLHILLKNIFQ